MNVKVILFAGAAVLALAACSKNEVVETNDHAIGFSNYAPKVVDGRADSTFVNGNNLVSGQKFVVYGYNQKAADFSTTLNPTFMPGVEVTYKGGNTLETAGSNTYSPTRYWPKDEANNKLAFYAYYPVSTHVVPTVTEGLGSYAVTVDTDPSKKLTGKGWTFHFAYQGPANVAHFIVLTTNGVDVLDGNGNPVLDANGNPTVELTTYKICIGQGSYDEYNSAGQFVKTHTPIAPVSGSFVPSTVTIDADGNVGGAVWNEYEIDLTGTEFFKNGLPNAGCNMVTLSSGGVAGTPIKLDAMFLYKK